MIFLDEDSPPPRPKLLVPPVLDKLGVEELRTYISDLESEILRVKAVILAKQAHAEAAAAFFKPKPPGAE
jgi:uncharacterized small protein (DUF1192 family)